MSSMSRKQQNTSHPEEMEPFFVQPKDSATAELGARACAPTTQQSRSKIGVLPLVAIIFYEVSGGPFGSEDAVRAGGPLLAILGFIVFPMLWSVPEALITAELGSAFPDDGGFVTWVNAAFGPFWAFQVGWWSWLSGVVDNSVYPVLFLEYILVAMPMLASGAPRWIFLATFVTLLTILNYRGMAIVGHAAVMLCAFSVAPFIALVVIGIPQMELANLLVVEWEEVAWGNYLNILFWNLNYWDSISTIVGEVDDPQRTLPKALSWAVLLVVSAYLLPIVVGVGVSPDWRSWKEGYFAVVARQLGGQALYGWVVAAAAVSNIGLYTAEMSSDAFQLLGMAELGLLPAALSKRSIYGTPTYPILFSSAGILVLAAFSLQEIIEFLNFLYCLAELVEFAAFLKLRICQPNLERAYTVPLDTVGCALMLLPGSGFVLLVMALATRQTLLFSACFVLLGLTLPALLGLAKERAWCEFYEAPGPMDSDASQRNEEKVEQNDEEDGRIRILAYDIEGGQADELAKHVASMAKNTGCEMVAIGVDEVRSKLIFGCVAANRGDAGAYMKAFAEAHKADLEKYCNSSASLTAKGAMFYNGKKGRHPVAAGQYLRIVKIPGKQEAVMAFSAEIRGKWGDKQVPGLQCTGYAMVEGEDDLVVGYQCFDSKEHADDYKAKALELYKEKGFDKTGYEEASGKIIHAHQSRGFVGMPAIGEQRDVSSNPSRNVMDDVFVQIPRGSYVVGGVSYTVDGITEAGSLVHATTADGTKESYKVTKKGLEFDSSWCQVFI